MQGGFLCYEGPMSTGVTGHLQTNVDNHCIHHRPVEQEAETLCPTPPPSNKQSSAVIHDVSTP